LRRRLGEVGVGDAQALASVAVEPLEAQGVDVGALLGSGPRRLAILVAEAA
jgi:hypothetical protein